MQAVKLAMIGCGRATESLHLPAAAVCSGVETTVLVDKDEGRARALADAYRIGATRSTVADVAGMADAAVVALPHHLHAPVARELLELGLHVLVEKPLALTVAECEELARLAAERGLTLAVGMIRRSFPNLRFVKRALERELLGQIESVELREGAPFSWAVASDFTFRRETGGGVLADTGVHVLDLLSWWFDGTERGLSVRGYRDDAFGGVEADCEIELELPGGQPATVELSRTRQLSNSVRIAGSRGVLTAGTGFAGETSLDLGGAPLVGEVRPAERRFQNVRELFTVQLADFRDAVRSGRSPSVGAVDATRAVRLLEACRERREPLRLPWLDVGERAAA